MTFKIKKVTFGDDSILYYPMVKKNFWTRWYYFAVILGQVFLSDKKGLKGLSNAIKAREMIDTFKMIEVKPKIIKTKDILID